MFAQRNKSLFVFTLQLIARVFDRTTRQETDDALGVFVTVDDQNDNAPQFSGQMQFTVPEKSKAGEEHDT